MSTSLYSASAPIGELSSVECPVEDIQADVSIWSESQTSTPRPKKFQKHTSVEDEMLKYIRDIKEKCTKDEVQETEDDYIGKLVATVLKHLPNRAKAVARLEIAKILLNEEFPNNWIACTWH